MKQTNTKESSLKQALTYPKRPKYNSLIDQQQKGPKVICNLKKIKLSSTSKRIRQYAVHFDPPIPENDYPLKKRVIKKLRSELTKNFKLYLQAGDTIFVCGDQCQDSISLQTKYEDTPYNVTFTSTRNNINCSEITTKNSEHIKTKHFIESLFKHIIEANNHIVFFKDGSFYDVHDVEVFGRDGKSKIMHGYSTAFCITESGLYLRINDRNKLVTGKTAYDKVMEISHKFGNNLNSEEFRLELESYFVGKTLFAPYGNYSAYRIGKIDFDRTPKNTSIEMKGVDGKTSNITIENYYHNRYNINLKYGNQFLFVDEDCIRKQEENVRYLVPELLFLTGVDELNERDRADIITKSKFQPSDKVRRIEKGINYLSKCEKKNVQKNGKTIQLRSPKDIRDEWGINFDDKFVQVDARCLNLPEMEFRGSKPEKPQISHGRFRQKQDIAGVNFDSSNCTLITFEKIVSLAKNDCDQMCKACGSFGVMFKFPQLIKLTSHNNDGLQKELSNITFPKEKKMCIVVLDKSTKGLYPMIKNHLYTKSGITSQFMLHDENPNRGGKKKQNMSYYSAVLNQMVVKAQGELFRVNFPAISSNPSMIMGIDSSKCSEGTKYVVSASYNKFFNKFYTDFGIMKRDEKNDGDNNFAKVIRNCMSYFEKINHTKPEVIIIYRQGGNEKQTEKVMRIELPIIEKAIFNDKYKPKLTIFSVNKKTDLKFFEVDYNNKGYRNIPMGTIIDKVVVSPDVFEFYLQCPDVEKGTGTPVHFLCLYNSNENLTANDFEEITFRQSYYYWNWPGPIRVPAALKYAEVANQFSSKNIKGEVIEKLKDSPYYI